MNLRGIQPGDVVRCDVRGRTFDAPVLVVSGNEIVVDPPAGITYHRVTARQVRARITRGGFDPASTQKTGANPQK